MPFVLQGQSLTDLAIQHYGAVEGIVPLCSDNPHLARNWHDIPVPGTEIFIKSAPVDAEMKAYYAANAITPASLTAEDYADAATDGGDFNDDFNDDFYV